MGPEPPHRASRRRRDDRSPGAGADGRSRRAGRVCQQSRPPGDARGPGHRARRPDRGQHDPEPDPRRRAPFPGRAQQALRAGADAADHRHPPARQPQEARTSAVRGRPRAGDGGGHQLRERSQSPLLRPPGGKEDPRAPADHPQGPGSGHGAGRPAALRRQHLGPGPRGRAGPVRGDEARRRARAARRASGTRAGHLRPGPAPARGAGAAGRLSARSGIGDDSGGGRGAGPRAPPTCAWPSGRSKPRSARCPWLGPRESTISRSELTTSGSQKGRRRPGPRCRSRCRSSTAARRRRSGRAPCSGRRSRDSRH